MAQRIGIVGGTFDPIHIGHLILAVRAREQRALDCVYLIPNWQSPLKSMAPRASFDDRLTMAQRAVDGIDGLMVSDIEGRRGGVSYMIDTLRQLHDDHAEAELHLIIGADALRELPQWRESEEITRIATIAAVSRGGETVDTGDVDAVAVSMPRIDVSASDIRERVSAGKSIDFLTPAPVVAYIREQQLYG
ncbi:MAG: nicotinate (nicotinamide) nucleotide adenylyltransferase [candidate division Zixibacteria bacterium]|nr:nicotinate (nicotinamide) nucleotide adenylyltransferase [candidate division Zixibacteria bacterium]